MKNTVSKTEYVLHMCSSCTLLRGVVKTVQSTGTQQLHNIFCVLNVI